MFHQRLRHVAAMACAALLFLNLAACSKSVRLVHAPNLYLIEGPAAYDGVPEAQRTRDAEVIYVTDRKMTRETDSGPQYGSGRALRIDYGLATVDLGDGTWDDLVKASTQRTTSLAPMSVTATVPVGHFNLEPQYYEILPDGSMDYSHEGRQIIAAQREQFSTFLSQRLALAGSGDVYVIVHGFSVTFPGAMFTTTHIWHYLGRPGVAIGYSWPSGHSGLLRGYTYDRESSEFTVTHFKNLLRSIVACPDVKRLHIIGHSRGTQVVADAVRELHLAYQAQGKQTYEEMKLETVVLAAPDMDWEVFRQRFIGDNATNAPRRLVVYVSPHDEAIGMSDWLFSSGRRLGRLLGSDLTTAGQNYLRQSDRIQVINCQVSKFGTSHNYFYAHPAVLSDLILVLRDRRKPGAEHGRPMQQDEAGLWQITNGYPDPQLLRATPASEAAASKP